MTLDNIVNKIKNKFNYIKDYTSLYKEILAMNLKTRGIGKPLTIGALAVVPNLNAQQATVQVIPKDSQTQTNLEGVLINVYNVDNDLINSGISTNEGVTFGLTTNVEKTKSKSKINFNPITRELNYNLNSTSKVEIILTGLLGKQKKLYDNIEFGNNSHKLNFDNLASGNYTLQVISKDFFAVYNFNLTNNKINLNTKNYVKEFNKISNSSLKKLDSGKMYKFVAESIDHFKDSINVVVENDMSLDLLMDKSKKIHFMIYNNDTDSMDIGYVKVNGDSLFVDKETDIDVTYNDTLKFVAGILRNGENFSFLRTKEYLPEDLPDSIKEYVVDFALRDINFVEVGELNEDTMSPDRFKKFSQLTHFNYVALGAIGGYKSNNGKLPDSLVIADTAYFFDTNTEGIMEQKTIDRIIKVYDDWIKPLIGQKNIPIKIKNKVNTGDGSYDFGYVLIVPSGSTNVVGSSAIWRSLPATIEFAQATLRSGQPYGDPGDDSGTRATIQELWSCIFGYNPSIRNVDDIIKREESIMHDSGTDKPTKYDFKLVRITTNEHYEYNEPINKILGGL